MKILECKYCKSKNLILEPLVKGEDVKTANMVALKCADCGKWIKWCPKEERHFYIKEKVYIQKMKEAVNNSDIEEGHFECDKILCEFLIDLGFNEIVEIYEIQKKWYS